MLPKDCAAPRPALPACRPSRAARPHAWVAVRYANGAWQDLGVAWQLVPAAGQPTFIAVRPTRIPRPHACVAGQRVRVAVRQTQVSAQHPQVAAQHVRPAVKHARVAPQHARAAPQHAWIAGRRAPIAAQLARTAVLHARSAVQGTGPCRGGPVAIPPWDAASPVQVHALRFAARGALFRRTCPCLHGWLPFRGMPMAG